MRNLIKDIRCLRTRSSYKGENPSSQAVRSCDSTTVISWIIMLCFNPVADAHG